MFKLGEDLKRTKKDAEKTRNAILKAAVNVFAEKGYCRSTINDIASAAHVTRGAFYWHFKNKVDVFTALAQNIDEPLQQIYEPVLTDENATLEDLKHMIYKLFHMITTDVQFQKIYEILNFKTELHGELSELMHKFRKDYEKYIFLIEHILSHLQKKEEIRNNINIKAASAGLLSFFVGIMDTWLMHKELFSLQEYGMEMLNVYFKGLEKENK